MFNLCATFCVRAHSSFYNHKLVVLLRAVQFLINHFHFRHRLTTAAPKPGFEGTPTSRARHWLACAHTRSCVTQVPHPMPDYPCPLSGDAGYYRGPCLNPGLASLRPKPNQGPSEQAFVTHVSLNSNTTSFFSFLPITVPMFCLPLFAAPTLFINCVFRRCFSPFVLLGRFFVQTNFKKY